MTWNWELPDWPKFTYNPDDIALIERKFLIDMGSACACLKTIDAEEYHLFVVEILSTEGIKSSKIEGEVLDRESLQSSIKRHFGLKEDTKKVKEKEAGMAGTLISLYHTFQEPLTHEMLWHWHALLFQGDTHLTKGSYRTHAEPMQIISNKIGSEKVYFEAPPSDRVFQEMTHFITWFNQSQGSSPILGRAALAHLYFENIHPFEDGNGRIGRLLVEKILSQEAKRPILIAVSKVLEKRRKEYYAALERMNRSLEANEWVKFFAETIVQAEQESLSLLYFLIEKSKLLFSLLGQLSSRQEKVLLRMFAEGPEGFQGGLSAENYIAITKASRATATRDLSDLVEKGALVKKGELRHTRYWLNLTSSYKKFDI